MNKIENLNIDVIRNREKALQQLQSKRKVEFKLNGDMAQEFNNSHYSDIDDIQWSDGEFYKY